MKNYQTSIFNNVDSTNAIRANLLYVSSSSYNSNWPSHPHTHYCMEIFYITEGKGYFQIEDQTYPVSSHDLVIINHDVKHTEISDPVHHLAYIVLGIENLELSLFNNNNADFSIYPLTSTKDVAHFYFSHLLNESLQNTPESPIICKNLAENLILLLGRKTPFEIAPTPELKNHTVLCMNIKRYIDIHYNENITLDTLAELAHVSKYHMAHVFTEEYGIPPINYLISKRIEEGKKLLKTTDYSLAFIGRTLGFSSPSYFSQVFKKHMLCTPLEYRKQSRKRKNS